MPNYEGGMPRGYVVKYRAAGSLEYQVSEVSGGEARGITVKELSPGTEYLFTVHARNPQGPSSYVTPHVTATTHGVSGHPSTWPGMAGGSRSMVEEGSSRMPRLMLLIITLTGAALLALNVAIIGCFIRRRAINRNASASSSTKNVAVDVYGVTPASTPGVVHNEALLSLTTMSPHLPSTTPPPYEEDHQTNVDDCDPPSLVIPNATTHTTSRTPKHPHAHSTPRQNGMVGRDVSSLYSRTMSPKTIERLATNQNSPTPASGGGGEVSSSSPRASPLMQGDGEAKDIKEIRQQTSEEVTSLCSSTYDSLPNDPQQPQQEQSLAPYSSADQTSLSSYHSDYSRSYEYSNGLVHPIYHQGCPHHHHHHHHQQARTTPHYQTPHDARTYHQPQQSEQQELIQAPVPYSGLNPSGLYNLGSEYHETRASPTSFGTGSPAGYATLGPRRRKPMPSKFASLQRPRSSHSHSHIHSHSQSQQRPSSGLQTEGHQHLLQEEGSDRLGTDNVDQATGDDQKGSQRRGTMQSFDPPTLLTSHGHPALQQADAGLLTGNETQLGHQNGQGDIHGHSHTHSHRHTHTSGSHPDSFCPRHGNTSGFTQSSSDRHQRVSGNHLPPSEPNYGIKAHTSSSSHNQRTSSPNHLINSSNERSSSPKPRTSSPHHRISSPNQRIISPNQRTNSPTNQRITSPTNQRITSPNQRTNSPTNQRANSPSQRSDPPSRRTSFSSQRLTNSQNPGKFPKDERTAAEGPQFTAPVVVESSGTLAETTTLASAGRPRFPHDFVRNIPRTITHETYEDNSVGGHNTDNSRR
ncbi:LIM domain-containing protein A-like [Homarus americanus]|uniref:Putative Fibronectin type III domain-containing protein-like 2 n=1 Tax=Homarus americanus TaxID=6706 RepID=A0A8J5JNE8_HOMAM|nr:LIM domain-containing protein A-like [Homarus americanus]KAG7161567.1 putative Fibronectin type III domain-containing protein-like 2 [Homarus americanus]